MPDDEDPGRDFYVAADGNDNNHGRNHHNAFATVQKAVDSAQAGDNIYLSAGEYDEAVTIGATKTGLTIKSLEGRGSAFIAPSATNATALTVEADDTTLIEVGCEGDGTGSGLHVKACRRFRATGCKIEGGAVACKLESTATDSVGDTIFDDCEICWSTDGVNFVVSGGGDPVTQTRFKDCLFHNLTDAGIEAVTTHTADCWVQDCIFAAQEDGSETTDYLLLAVASTTGLVTGCKFATATNATATLNIATGVFFAGNVTEAGVTAARPS